MLVILCAKAYVHLIAVGVRLRHVDISEHLDRSERPGSDAPQLTPAEEARAVARAERALRIAERLFPVRIACLQRSLVLQRLLGGLGVATRLQIGVRREQTELKAHAWLEYKGQPLNTAPDHQSQFHVLQPVRTKSDRT